MSRRIDLTGRWRYQEDFGFGKDNGFAELMQQGSKLMGELRFAEQIEGEETFLVKQEVTGNIHGNKIKIKSHSCEILFSDEDIIYELDTWEGEITPDGRIIGKSRDAEGTQGVFLMERADIENDPFTDKLQNRFN